jgi:hypothetical protein
VGNKYYCPLSRTVGIVDSWIKNIGFFQITTNLQYDINMIEIDKCFSSSSKSRLYFVVPSSLFESFKKQNFIPTEEEKVSKKVLANLNKLEQYVLSIDLSLNTEKRKADGLYLNQTNSIKKAKT